mgnify:CR=1 FL=1
MKKHCILVSGSTVAIDEELVDELQKSAKVLKNTDNNQVEAIISERKVDLILFEISKDHFSEVEIIKSVKTRFPNIEILLINGNQDRELTAKAFSYGAKDAFRKPYKSPLIVERVNALLGR